MSKDHKIKDTPHKQGSKQPEAEVERVMQQSGLTDERDNPGHEAEDAKPQHR